MKFKIGLQLRDLVDKIVGEESRISPEHRQEALDVSLAVMALVAAADKHIDESEILMVQELYAKQGGGLVDTATVRRAFDIVVSEEALTWQQLDASKRLSNEVREDIFGAALKIAGADSNLHEDELNLLMRIGTALGLSKPRLDDLCGSHS